MPRFSFLTCRFDLKAVFPTASSAGSEFETTKRAGGSPEFLVVFSDPANSHRSRSTVNAGPSPALQRRGTQPGAGGHADLPATAHAAQGNGHRRSAYRVDKKDILSCK